MLTEEKIDTLLEDLLDSHQHAVNIATRVAVAQGRRDRAAAVALAGYPYVGKDTTARKHEADAVLHAEAEWVDAARMCRKAEADLALAKAEVKVAEEVISLWRALAYQEGGKREVGSGHTEGR